MVMAANIQSLSAIVHKAAGAVGKVPALPADAVLFLEKISAGFGVALVDVQRRNAQLTLGKAGTGL